MASRRESSSRSVLVIDDDPSVSILLGASIGMKTIGMADFSDLKSKIDGYHPVGAFVDLDLGVGGMSLPKIPLLREMLPFHPIIIVTSAVDPQLVAEGLSLGADDFIRKPFNALEIRARFEARLLDRQNLKNVAQSRFKNLELDKKSCRVSGPSNSALLSAKESLLLEMLINAGGSCVSRKRLERIVWGETTVTRNSLDKRIQSLKRVLKDIGAKVEIFSDYGKGYRLGSRYVTAGEDPQ